jgi:hypothetical protein
MINDGSLIFDKNSGFFLHILFWIKLESLYGCTDHKFKISFAEMLTKESG